MKLSTWILPAFVVVALGQLAVPSWMILREERVLRDGAAYKFRTQPIDPVDVFRGRYVALSLEPNHVAVATNETFVYRSTVYVTLGQGPDGFAILTGWSRTLPESGDYLEVTTWGAHEGKLSVRLPFDRYYMEETEAPAAERAYWEHSRRGQRDAHVAVRVLNGRGVIEELYIAGKPIRQFLKGANDKPARR